MRIAVIGAGAAGCFCAIELKRRMPSAEVTVYEAGTVPLAKVAVTGGGRCNFTNSFRDVTRLEEVYPRGARIMKRALKMFGPDDIRQWFENEGVPSVVQEDQCVFPKSQDAMQIVRTLERLMNELGVKLVCGRRIGNISEVRADTTIVTTGGTSDKTLAALLPDDVKTVPTVPSLYTFKIADTGLKALMGTVAEKACVKLAGTAFKACGPLLVTDWGVSGPATLKLSSFAARHLADCGWQGNLIVCWNGFTEEETREWIAGKALGDPQKMISGTPPPGLTGRLWKHLVQRSGLREDIRWNELGSKGANKLTNSLISDTYAITGRARFKEEFVTCGGVSLDEVDPTTLESRKHPGLHFAGEVLDIDAVTGGFNLQAAWSTAYAVAKAVSEK